MAKKAKRARVDFLGPTAEQFLHARIVKGETMAAGVYNHRDLDECLLDRMLQDGFLGEKDSDPAKRRYEAGMWLRQLFHKAQIATAVVSERAYTGVGRGGEEMPEHVSWNRKVYNETLRDLSAFSRALERLCCYDQQVKAFTACAALDALAKLRGM